MKLIGLRHLEDANALLSHLFDAPLLAGQEHKAAEMAAAVAAAAAREGARSVRILFSEQLRAVQTAQMVAAALRKQGVVISSMTPEKGLKEIDQGQPVLPVGYTDGDFLPALATAWERFCEEAYDHDNLDYRFGAAQGTATYPELAGQFKRLGESLADMLPRQYAFLVRLLAGEFHREGELLVVVSHNTTLLTLCELHQLAVEIQGGLNVTPEALPGLCWQMYCQHGGTAFSAKLGFGAVVEYDLATLSQSALPGLLAQAVEFFTHRDLPMAA